MLSFLRYSICIFSYMCQMHWHMVIMFRSLLLLALRLNPWYCLFSLQIFWPAWLLSYYCFLWFLNSKFLLTRKCSYRMLTYGIPIMISSLAYVTNENLDKLLLSKYLGKEQMGIYAACYKLRCFYVIVYHGF